MSDINTVTVPAKINLSLAITGKAGNLHTLEMVVCHKYTYCDEVTFIPTEGNGIEDISVRAGFDGLDKMRFLTFFWPKVQFIARKLGLNGQLKVTKGIPLGAGLGGSSASIVAAIKAMRAYNRSIGNFTQLDDGFLLSLGSDVPCMMRGRAGIVRGVGDKLFTFEIPYDTDDMVIKIAEGGSDTKACYALYDELKKQNKDTSKIPDVEDDGEPLTMEGITLFKNDLTLPAVMLNPNIKDTIVELKRDYEHVVMSGSGSAVIAMGKKNN